ncbi:MAG: hypothetical protein MJK05_07490 [Nitrosopumilus sp.]|nr:hypothetical protein [Nitrosopumilus sp.]
MGKYYRDTRDRVLSSDVKEHFEQSRRSVAKNLKIINKIKSPIYSTEDSTALLEMIKITSNRLFSSLDSMNGDIEALYVYHCLNRERFSEIYKVLEEHGIKLKNSENDEGLKWINSYFKHVSETSHD